MNHKSKKILRISIIIILLLTITVSIAAFYLYNKIFEPNVFVKNTEYLFINEDATVDDVMDSLQKNFKINNTITLEWVAKKKNYANHIHSGRYKIKNGLNNNELIDLLRSGKQEPVMVTFNNIRIKEQLAERISKQILADSVQIMKLLNNDDYLEQFGVNSTTVLALFLPNTYEFYWNTSADGFIKRMHKEYAKFWTEERKEKAKKIKLTPVEVSILASIVQAEQAVHKDEQDEIAGVYINRLRKGMLLQSCPTLVYAIGDFSIKRVLDKHKEIVSPYNTYMYAGLPPSPINLPEISAIDAVLNYDKHNYLFFCAKEDFSGYHYFSKSNAQHEYYAQKYQRELDKRGIR